MKNRFEKHHLPVIALGVSGLFFLTGFVFLHFLNSSSVPLGFPDQALEEEGVSSAQWNSPAAAALGSVLPDFPQKRTVPAERNASASGQDASFPDPAREAGVGRGVGAASRSHRTVLILGFNHLQAASRIKTMQALEQLLKTTSERDLAFEFPRDLQAAFDAYRVSNQRFREKEQFTLAMLARYPPATRLNRREKLQCARKLLESESIKSVLDIAALAKKYGAGVHLIDTPMSSVSLFDPKIAYRNRMMADHLMEGARGPTVVALVGSAHTGHGDLRLSLDDSLMRLGAETLSVNVGSTRVPHRRDWGTNRHSADHDISQPGELVGLLAGRLPVK